MPQKKYSIFDHLIEGVQIIDPDWRYVYVNHTVAAQGKCVREELMGATMMEKYPGIEQTELFAFIRQCQQDRKPRQWINTFDFPDGSKGYFELRMQAVPEGVLIFSFDVTQQKRAEEYLKNSNEILDEKVRQRTAELEQKNKELEQFTYIASHDLQEPLRTLTNYLQVLKEDCSPSLGDNGERYLQSMQKAADRMSLLIRTLLDFSRLGKNSTWHLADTGLLLQQVLDDLHDNIQRSGARIHASGMPVLNVYEAEFRQLLQNLLSNAIKFRRPDTAPEIHLTVEKEEGFWRFTVSDNGIGIAPAHFDRIFQIFQRLHHSKTYEGNGIGLANCRKIVELHGGKISVHSVPGEGSAFSFTVSETLSDHTHEESTLHPAD